MKLQVDVTLSQFNIPEVIDLMKSPHDEAAMIDYINKKLQKAFELGRKYERADPKENA